MPKVYHCESDFGGWVVVRLVNGLFYYCEWCPTYQQAQERANEWPDGFVFSADSVIRA